MPHYNNEKQELVYTSAESEPFGCPVCGAGQEFGDCEILDSDYVRSRWTCPECGAVGCAYDKLTFDGHRVEIATVSPETQREHAAIKTMCVNGPLRVGDRVLSTDGCSGFPWLPGIVTDIRLLGSDRHDTNNIDDDVYVDFRGCYKLARKQEIVSAFTPPYGKPPAFEDIRLDNIIMPPGSLLNISGIVATTLEDIMSKEERAIRYAYHVIRHMLASAGVTA